MSLAKYYSGQTHLVRESVSRHQAMHIAMSRRQFFQTATGATVLGAAALGGNLLRPTTASAQGVGNVLPIPTTMTVFGVDIHVQAPPFSGVATDPSTVWNFRGSSGIAFINTTATRRHRRTGEQRDLPSLFNHMTFMKGVYQGRDGHVREGTFSLV
jgi:hypothetical protein